MLNLLNSEAGTPHPRTESVALVVTGARLEYLPRAFSIRSHALLPCVTCLTWVHVPVGLVGLRLFAGRSRDFSPGCIIKTPFLRAIFYFILCSHGFLHTE